MDEKLYQFLGKVCGSWAMRPGDGWQVGVFWNWIG